MGITAWQRQYSRGLITSRQSGELFSDQMNLNRHLSFTKWPNKKIIPIAKKRMLQSSWAINLNVPSTPSNKICPADCSCPNNNRTTNITHKRCFTKHCLGKEEPSDTKCSDQNTSESWENYNVQTKMSS